MTFIHFSSATVISSVAKGISGRGVSRAGVSRAGRGYMGKNTLVPPHSLNDIKITNYFN